MKILLSLMILILILSGCESEATTAQEKATAEAACRTFVAMYDPVVAPRDCRCVPHFHRDSRWLYRKGLEAVIDIAACTVPGGQQGGREYPPVSLACMGRGAPIEGACSLLPP